MANAVAIAMESFENLVKESLECPICYDLPVGPIFICERGHSVCSNCRPNILACPICKEALTTIRNICAEKIAANIAEKYCKYNSYGCLVQLMKHQKQTHEENCQHRPHRCDLPAAFGSGTTRCNGIIIPTQNMTEHMRRNHNLDGSVSNTMKLSYTLTDKEIRTQKFNQSKCQARFFKCFGCLFLGLASIEEKTRSLNFCICTSHNMLGEYSKDSFIAKISLQNNNSKFSLLWQGPVHDSKIKFDDVSTAGTCLSIKMENLLPFCYNYNKGRKNHSFYVHFSVEKNEP